MKFNSRSYLIVLAWLTGATVAGALAGCAAGPASPEEQTSAANSVVSEYQIGDMLAQAAPAVMDSLDHNLPDDVSDATKAQVGATVDQSLATEPMRNDVVARLKSAAEQADNPDYLGKAAADLQTPLAQRMIDLEGRVSQPGFGDGFAKFAEAKPDDQREARLAIVKDLARDMQVTTLQTNFNVALLSTMISTRNAVVSDDNRLGQAQTQRILSNSRDGIGAKLDQQVPMMLLYVYRSVDTPTLKKYARLQARPEMVWTNKNLANAVLASLSAAGDKIPQQLNAKD